MRRWLRTLHGRLVMLLLSALLVAQAVALLLLVLEQESFIDEINEVIATRRLPAAVALLQDLSADQRRRFAAALSTPWTQFSIGAAATLGATGAYPDFSRRLAETLGRPIERVRIDRVAAPLRDAPPVRWSDESLRVEIRLDAHTWLRLERPLNSPLHHTVGPVGLSLLLSALAVLAVVAWLTRRITRPLTALSEAADRFGRGDPGPPLIETGPEDLRYAIRAFNVMSLRLQRFITDRTRMLAAISHDLRTPITALRLRTEMIDDEATRGRMERSLAEMQRMVEATLEFAHADATQEPAVFLELDELLEGICADVRDAGGEVRCSAPPGIGLTARSTALGRALRNLVENAVFYGRRAEVTLALHGDSVFITIDDTGPGIPVADRERVFEPFVRLENSRSSDTGGIGLGLATARTIVHAHGGEIVLADSPLGGLRAEVVLPLCGTIERSA